jgi:hypothetical protein
LFIYSIRKRSLGEREELYKKLIKRGKKVIKGGGRELSPGTEKF